MLSSFGGNHKNGLRACHVETPGPVLEAPVPS
jgi:hypothetical protein